MKVLVTGHDGYIGAVMVRVLSQAGHEVVGLDTYYFRGCLFGEDDTAIPALGKDIRDVTRQDLQGIDAVVHLAALSNDPMGDINPDLTYDINFQASVKLAQAAKDAGVGRFLFSSSCSVYGSSNGEMITENGPVTPLTAYAISKVRTEEGISKLADESFSPVFLRNATAYGVSSRLRLDLVLNNLVGWAHTTGEVRIMSDGTPRRPIVHIEDIARAFAAMLEAPREAMHNQVFNVGANNENYQVREMAEMVHDTVPNCTVEYAGEGSADARDYWVDFSKIAREVPQFTLKWNARDGVKELYSAYKQVGLQVADLETGRQYIRLRQLRHLMDSGSLTSELRWVRGD